MRLQWLTGLGTISFGVYLFHVGIYARGLLTASALETHNGSGVVPTCPLIGSTSVPFVFMIGIAIAPLVRLFIVYRFRTHLLATYVGFCKRSHPIRSQHRRQ
jgi:hypothetical protein